MRSKGDFLIELNFVRCAAYWKKEREKWFEDWVANHFIGHSLCQRIQSELDCSDSWSPWSSTRIHRSSKYLNLKFSSFPNRFELFYSQIRSFHWNEEKHDEVFQWNAKRNLWSDLKSDSEPQWLDVEATFSRFRCLQTLIKFEAPDNILIRIFLIFLFTDNCWLLAAKPVRRKCSIESFKIAACDCLESHKKKVWIFKFWISATHTNEWLANHQTLRECCTWQSCLSTVTALHWADSTWDKTSSLRLNYGDLSLMVAKPVSQSLTHTPFILTITFVDQFAFELLVHLNVLSKCYSQISRLTAEVQEFRCEFQFATTWMPFFCSYYLMS